MVLALVLLAVGPAAWCQSAAPNDKPIEMTQVDFFSVPRWPERRVSIKGFILGMARSDALKIAHAQGLRLVAYDPRTAGGFESPCDEARASCSVYEGRGPYIGIDLYFNEADRVSRMAVSVSEDMGPEVRKTNVTRQFEGLTRQLFNEYSENLRQRIFGNAEPKERPEMPGSPITRIEYDYPQAGATVRITIDKRDHPPHAFD